MAFINLLDIYYPVGSLFLSVSNISPAEIMGGKWTKITGAVLAATGANGFAAAGAIGGSLKISINQMPKHNHALGYSWSSTNGGWANFRCGTETTAGTAPSSNYTGGGANYLPYHYAVNVWRRTS